MILSKTDFTGVWLISLNGVNDSYINSIIADTEKKYLRMLLGDDLYLQFITGLGETVIPQKWLDLRDGKNYTYVDRMFIWEGVKEMLKYFTWVEYHNQSRQMSKPTGLAVPSIENSEVLNNADMGVVLSAHYNKGVYIALNGHDFITRTNDTTPDTYTKYDLFYTDNFKYMTW